MKKILGLILFIFMVFASGLALAENLDVTTGQDYGVPANTFGPYTVEYYLDASQHNDGDGFAINATLDCIKAPKGSVIYGVHYEVVSGEANATTCTIDIGDASNATGFLSNQNCNSTATTNAFALTYDGTAGKQNTTSAGKVRITFDHATDTLKAYVRAVIIPFKNRP